VFECLGEFPEGAQNIFAAKSFPPKTGDFNVIAGGLPLYDDILSSSELFHTPKGEAGDPDSVTRAGRIKFPGEVYVYASTLDDIKKDVFPGTLDVLVGQPLIFGWHVAMFKALTTSDDSWIARLWQAALTVTMHVVVGKSVEELATDAMIATDKMVSVAAAMDESWPTFALKVVLATRSESKIADKLTLCVDKGIRYQRTVIHRTMLSAAHSYYEKIDPVGHAAFLGFERKHGKNLLTKKWSNMTRLITICSQEIDRAAQMWDEQTVSDLVAQVLAYASWCVDHDKYELREKGITVEWLDKARDGTAGHAYLVLAKLQLKAHLESLVKELPPGSATRTDILKVFAFFNGYESFQHAFDNDAPAPGGASGASTPAGGEGPEDADRFDVIKNSFGNKTAQALLDFLFDLFAGDHDQDLLAWCGKMGKGAIALTSWCELEKGLRTKYEELTRQLGLHKSLISTSSAGAAPGQTSRSLKRSLSKGDDDDDEATTGDAREKEMRRERDETWKNVQAARKRLLGFSVNKNSRPEDIQKWMESRHPTVFQFKGEAGKSHRVFLFSAELFGVEQVDEPWQDCSSTTAYDAVMDYICAQNGPFDTLMVFDGRIGGQTRRDLSKKMDMSRNSTEIWIVYLESCRFGRRAAWSQANRELGWLSFPVPLVQIPAKTRDGNAKAWAPSTRCSTYERVPPAPWDSLPLMSYDDKKTMLGHAPAQTKPNIFDCDRGLPLYWGERKPVPLWVDLFFCVDAKMVIDFSPGSGAAARACMELGIEYRGICRSEMHQSWLANVLDRDACCLITEESPLFEQDLSELIKKHFQDILEQGKERSNAKDNDPGSDVDM